MAFHFAVTKKYDFETLAAEADAGQRPRHVLWQLAQELGAEIHAPGAQPVSAADRFLATLFSSQPAHWALARNLASILGPGDVVYCQSDTTGIPVAALCGGRTRGPMVAISVDHIDRPRARLALRYMQFARRVNLWLPLSVTQADFIRFYLRVDPARIHVVGVETDVRYFSPGPPSPQKIRPVITAVGLEQRDFRSLARATGDLDVDVRISAFSAHAKANLGELEQRPANMDVRFYPWPDLVQLYRDADVVVVPLLESNWPAGITTILEALACQRPVVVTRTKAIREYLNRHPDIAVGVPPGSAVDLRTAIVRLLDNPMAAEAMAHRGREVVARCYSSERRCAATIDALRRLG